MSDQPIVPSVDSLLERAKPATRRLLQGFVRKQRSVCRRADDALAFACHAALPVALTPHFLHILRINFFLDSPEFLPWSSEAALLLSPICRELEEGLFEIQEEVRGLLLEYLAERYGQERIRALAALLGHYSERGGVWLERESLKYAQQITALNFLAPDRAREWLEKAKQRVGQETGVDETWLIAMQRELAKREPIKPPFLPKTSNLAQRAIEWAYIPAGDFLMGDDDRKDNPRRTVYLDAYWISKHPVTVEQYMAFVKAEGYRKPQEPSWGWKNDHPIVNVSWDDAQAYCVWLSGLVGRKITLPTEAQWEKAARGTDGRKFPWGNDWDSSRLQCSKESYGDAGGTAAVGGYPGGASPYGVLEMAGNVWEWCQDVYDAEFWKRSSDELTNTDNNTSESARVLRGGSWYNDGGGDNFRCAYRYRNSPDDGSNGRGFRCAVPADSR